MTWVKDKHTEKTSLRFTQNTNETHWTAGNDAFECIRTYNLTKSRAKRQRDEEDVKSHTDELGSENEGA